MLVALEEMLVVLFAISVSLEDIAVALFVTLVFVVANAVVVALASNAV